MRWDPGLYLAFADERRRPAEDLLARVRHAGARTVLDLGCGTGEVTRLLRDRWPEARIVAVDASAEMLTEARRRHPDLEVSWVHADLREFTPDGPVDVVFSNAVLHWLGDHRQLLARWVGWLTAGGVLALQVPANQHAPTHTAAIAVAREGPWWPRLAPSVGPPPRWPPPVPDPATYLAWLEANGLTAEVWTTTYHHRLDDIDAVVRWMAGAGLRPLLDALDPASAERFLAAYRARLRHCYPPGADGTVVLPYRRTFAVGIRPADGGGR